MLKWIIGFLTPDVEAHGVATGVVIGSRVQTEFGRGVVTMGSITVKYDSVRNLPVKKGGRRHDTELTHTQQRSKCS